MNGFVLFLLWHIHIVNIVLFLVINFKSVHHPSKIEHKLLLISVHFVISLLSTSRFY
ncbi:hypothetical protein BDF20DRAFT_867599 [Mycotypha africana]|uniref:uncharacterized protein n=1 Tax=Mycotypha africana TaxID=64632 RepID=UPI0023017AC1|nr:uncharacterized protein BDF20DRAFT_867599 [Mycotypha africana]KAI8979099.1 hypothetical protein BDF20DRAFT_867599 [Mycotypha africana]